MKLAQTGRPSLLGHSGCHVPIKRSICSGTHRVRLCAKAAADVAVTGTTSSAANIQRTSPLVIGCRGTKLALQQAQQAQEMLTHANAECAHTACKIVEIQTRGDEDSSSSMRALGPGAFTEAIDAAVAAGEVDIGVHSLKDSPLHLPPGVVLGCCLPREDPRDVLISKGNVTLAQLPPGARVGTSSLRRRAQLLAAAPHLQVVPLRGSVHSRMAALNEGKVDATVMAAAGLKRLGLLDKVSQVFTLDEMLPAACQGTIGVTCRSSDRGMNWDLSLITHEPTLLEISCERAMLRVLLAPPPPSADSSEDSSGSDQERDQLPAAAAEAPATPAKPDSSVAGSRIYSPPFAIACNAHFEPSTGLLTCKGLVASPDGLAMKRIELSLGAGRAADAEGLGAKVGRKLRRAALKAGWYEPVPAV